MLSVFLCSRTPWLCYYLYLHLWRIFLYSFSDRRFHSFIRITIEFAIGLKCDNSFFFFSRLVCFCCCTHISVAVHKFVAIWGTCIRTEKNRNIILSIDFCSALHLLSLSHLARLQYMNFISLDWLSRSVRFSSVLLWLFPLLSCCVPCHSFASYSFFFQLVNSLLHWHKTIHYRMCVFVR